MSPTKANLENGSFIQEMNKVPCDQLRKDELNKKIVDLEVKVKDEKLRLDVSTSAPDYDSLSILNVEC